MISLAHNINERRKSLRKSLLALKDVPIINIENHALEYVYEYLISKFPAGTGKKSGGFFTSMEV